ncbi:hypothetical protein SDJN02_08203, partial [Cucurbita argyrosperma subsp. argyrosperma]
MARWREVGFREYRRRDNDGDGELRKTTTDHPTTDLV